MIAATSTLTSTTSFLMVMMIFFPPSMMVSPTFFKSSMTLGLYFSMIAATSTLTFSLTSLAAVLTFSQMSDHPYATSFPEYPMLMSVMIRTISPFTWIKTFFASINNDFLDFVQGIDDLWFQIFNGFLDASTDVITKFLGSSLHFVPDITESTFCHVGLIFG